MIYLGCDQSRQGFLGGARGKEPACQCRRQKRCRFNPCVRKVPWRNPLQCYCLENPHEQRSLVGCSTWGRKELDTTEVTQHVHTIKVSGREDKRKVQHKVTTEVERNGASGLDLSQNQKGRQFVNFCDVTDTRNGLDPSFLGRPILGIGYVYNERTSLYEWYQHGPQTYYRLKLSHLSKGQEVTFPVKIFGVGIGLFQSRGLRPAPLPHSWTACCICQQEQTTFWIKSTHK